VPLIEVVSEPDMRSADEALSYLAKLRALLVAAGVSDCKMERGAMRVDVNLSVRPGGDENLGTRTEIKNLNSLASVRRAIEGEFKRQAALLESGGEVSQETRRFDPASGTTSAMRSKENADDYRYFPDPDLPPIALSDEWIEQIRRALPELPDAKKARLAERYGLSPREAELFAAAPEFSTAFEAAWNSTEARESLKGLALSFLARSDGDVDADPSALSSLAEMLERGELNTAAALRALATGAAPSETAQLSDRAELFEIARRAVLENPELARSFRSGRQNAMKGLMGAVMRETCGRANPTLAEALLREALGV
jgi:aspartyl-tRNA(Asn)/glutamyl-tRNA(Gln) amidotransferase subunit B